MRAVKKMWSIYIHYTLGQFLEPGNARFTNEISKNKGKPSLNDSIS